MGRTPGSRSFYALLSRMKTIRRWSLMRSVTPEDVAQHSHMTAVLAHALAVIRRDVLNIPCNPDSVAAKALFHDAGEILTGDLPTPIKYYNQGITSAYRQVEEVASRKLLATLPPELQEAYRPLLACAEPGEEERLVKAADKLSAYIKCIEERMAGNNEFLQAEKKTLAKLREYRMPEVDYFLLHFIPGFELTLDELGTMDYREP